jgi:DeoR family glycerol-3-phosphate regulon repressor
MTRTGHALAAHRHAAILRRVDREGVASVAELADTLEVSRETIRRDLKALAESGRLRQVHGGAAVLQPAEPTLARRATINAGGKAAIGRAAATLVRDGASVIIDSGTTTDALAAALAVRRRLTVYTNSLDVARRLGTIEGNRLVILGGELQPHDRSTVGWDTVTALSQYRADLAFIGAGAISDEPWLTDYTRAGAELRARMLVAAGHVVVLADRSKFGRITPVRVPDFDKAHRLITDAAPDAAVARGLRKLKVAVTIAS